MKNIREPYWLYNRDAKRFDLIKKYIQFINGDMYGVTDIIAAFKVKQK